MKRPKINTAALRKVMRQYGDSNADLAKALYIKSATVISRKMCNWHDVRFKATELLLIAQRYAMTPETQNAVFGELIKYYNENYQFQ